MQTATGEGMQQLRGCVVELCSGDVELTAVYIKRHGQTLFCDRISFLLILQICVLVFRNHTRIYSLDKKMQKIRSLT